MKDHELENLEYLLQCYFHQDWNLDYKDPENAISDYINCENIDMVKLVIEELCVLESKGYEENKLRELLLQLGTYYAPWLNGSDTAISFLKKLLNQLVEHAYH